MHEKTIDMNIFKKRIEYLQKIMADEKCSGLIIDDQINLYYLTGLFLSAGFLLIHPQGAVLLVDSRYFEQCQSKSPFPVELATQSFGVIDLIASGKIKEIRTLGFISGQTTYSSFLELEKKVKHFNQKKFSMVLKPVSNLPLKLRAIKDFEEIDQLKEAARLGSEGFDYVKSLLQEGISEIELAIELEIFWKHRGSKAIAFDPIIAFGANSSMPHYKTGHRQLKKGDCVLIDIGVNLNHYHSDMTRVLFFGEPASLLKNIYEIVLQAQEEALKQCRPGAAITDLDKAARSIIEKAGYGEKFTHSLGHGVGLDIHELPTIRKQNNTPFKTLKEGMVITIEPGIYLPGIGGIRIEDTIVITADSYENLTNRSKKLEIIDPEKAQG